MSALLNGVLFALLALLHATASAIKSAMITGIRVISATDRSYR